MTASGVIVFGDEGRAILGFGGYSLTLVALFNEAELYQGDGEYGYASSARELRQRLHVQGFTDQRASADLRDAVDQFLTSTSTEDDLFKVDCPIIDEQWVLQTLKDHLNGGLYDSVQEPTEVTDHMDTRSYLRLAVDLVPDSMTVRYDLSRVMWGGVFRPGDRISEAARSDLSSQATESPLIVLTEGSSDAQVLELALARTHPHLVGFLRFMDFRTKAPAGAPGLDQTLRALWGAGVANRIVAVADNDAEAYRHLARIKRETLPENIRLIHYPDLPLLNTYPAGERTTKAGFPHENVNGRAGSLEMYLGENLLRVNGSLVPVRWVDGDGQIPRHGTLTKSDKKRVQSQFKKNARNELRGLNASETQDWTGVHAIIESIIAAFDVPQATHNARCNC